MSNNGESFGAAMDASAYAERRAADTERELRENKARAAVEYYKREHAAAETAVVNAEGKLARLQEQVAAQEVVVDTTYDERDAALHRIGEAEANERTVIFGEGN